MSTFIFDIETGGLSWEQLATMYTPPPPLPPFSEDMVKYGRMVDPAKRAEKRAAVFAEYETTLANEAVEREAHRQEFIDSAALSPVTGTILAIGLRTDNKTVIVGADESEQEILEGFWALYRKHAASGRFIGYCSNMFDFPFIVWRSYFHGTQVPASAWDKSGKYPAYCFVDLIDRLPKRGFSDESRKLTDVCSWLGLGSKPEGVDGSMFASLWNGNAESRKQAISYLANDLDMTWRLAERMGVIS